jgi:hypothetical protein
MAVSFYTLIQCSFEYNTHYITNILISIIIMTAKTELLLQILISSLAIKKSEAIPETDHGGLNGFEKSRIPHFLHN